MTPTKQFSGFLSSVSDPGQLSLTVKSFTSALLSFGVMLAVVKGLDQQTVSTQIQLIIDQTLTVGTVALTLWHSLQTLNGLAHKLWFVVAAKPVVTTPVAVGEAVQA